MKSRYCPPAEIQQLVEKAVEKETLRVMDDLTDQITSNAVYQTLATVFVVMDREYGFKKKRLNRLKNLIEDEFVHMKTGILGRDYSTADCVKYLKEHYDIDFSVSQYGGRFNE